ncbi:hypothetical protein TPA0907_55780 [Micromonospora humidisoli]|uniref:hypothetical protein n=1 Tax=Micromonospora sp. AKA109 TaxID=2733865 RepID=UPI0022BF3D54|nr:hypothetical protein [Micromonospora sp. AKA109]GHJ11211.1 hypothetical protein TPA0907_55780 [Micromonospora sp. AKA109]
MAELFELEDLRKLLRLSPDEFDSDAAGIARRQAGGWLSDATGLTAWTDPVPERLWSWAIELAAIAYNNPDGAQSEQIDDYKVVNDAQRRADILTAARSAYPSTAPAGSGPQWSFPAPDWSWGPAPRC